MSSSAGGILAEPSPLRIAARISPSTARSSLPSRSTAARQLFGTSFFSRSQSAVSIRKPSGLWQRRMWIRRSSAVSKRFGQIGHSNGCASTSWAESSALSSNAGWCPGLHSVQTQGLTISGVGGRGGAP